MRAVVVDDERLARSELIRLLEIHPAITVVGEAASAHEARELLRSVRPDLLFLDIHMPEESGFDLLESLEEVPVVVFTTAYDQHALKAFEVNAFDYLVKPIDSGRLARTIDRLEEGDPGYPEGATNRQTPEQPAPERVFLRDGDRCWFVYVHDIQLFSTEGNYTRVFFGDQKPLVLRSLNKLEERFAGSTFFRANRSEMINLDSIESVEPWFAGRLRVRLRGGHEVTVSRRRSVVFRDRMGL